MRYGLLLLFVACRAPDKVPSEADMLVDSDGDGVMESEDCDDSNAAVFPGAEEICDGLDNDCDDGIDEEVLGTYYLDIDGDGFGSVDIQIESCNPPGGYVSEAGDCNDDDALIHPQAEEVCDEIDNDCNEIVDDGLGSLFYVDADADGFGNSDNTILLCSIQQGYSSVDGDCNDYNENVYPQAPESCDEIDNDCDGIVDEDVQQTFYLDTDSDGYGDPLSTVLACSAPEGAVSNNQDCDDVNSEVSPVADEVCDEMDNDCDGLVDEAGALGSSTWYMDGDGDGYGTVDVSVISCNPASGYVSNSTDCNDEDANIAPSAAEICDGLDNDCNGLLDDDDGGVIDPQTWYLDHDGDGYGDSSFTISACLAPTGYILDGTDCNDFDADISPVADEVCDGIDNNCNGIVDGSNSIDQTVWYTDSDSDGFGDPAASVTACAQPAGASENDDDCDDNDTNINPDAIEQCDGVDNDCDASVDEGLLGLGMSCPANDCLEIITQSPSSSDGVYWLQSISTSNPFETYCDMTTDGGGFTLIAKVSANDASDNWSYDASLYIDSTTLGDTTTLTLEDAKSQAYFETQGMQLMISELSGSAYAIHTFSTEERNWGGYLNEIWNECGYAISTQADVLVDDNLDSVLGNALYFRHYDGYVPNCSSEERAMFSEVVSNAGYIEVGIGLTEGNAAYLDAQSFPSGASQYNYNIGGTLADFGFWVR